MTAPAEIQIDVTRATAKLRQIRVASQFQNDQVRALSRRYAELVELRTKIERSAIPVPPEDPKRPLPSRRTHTATQHLASYFHNSTPVSEWRDRYRKEQTHLAELDHEIEETLRARDQLSASFHSNFSVIKNVTDELHRRTGRRIEQF